MKQFDETPLFLGPKGENADEFQKLLCRLVGDYVGWRNATHIHDPQIITAHEKASPSHTKFFEEVDDGLRSLTRSLMQGVPFFSPRYIGHMNADLLIPALLGYIAALLHNPNNVTSESSPVTTRLELICGIQFAGLVGYIDDPGAAIQRCEHDGSLPGTWGHLTSGGTAANIEAAWVARNLKYFPLAVREAAKTLGVKLRIEVGGNERDISALNPWTLLNLPTDTVLGTQAAPGLRERLIRCAQKARRSAEDVDDALRQCSVGHLGLQRFLKIHRLSHPGVLLVPAPKHYSLPKLADVLGLGKDQIVHVPVDAHFRMDNQALRKELGRLRNERVPVIAVISVFGTTEEGAVDDHEGISRLREEFLHSEDPLAFHWHCDAAYGGYAISVMYDRAGKYSSDSGLKETVDRLKQSHRELNPRRRDEVGRGLDVWRQHIGRSARALRLTDSVTIDPHKWGYIPYPCGAIVFRHQSARDLTSVHAPYVFHSDKTAETSFIGRFILEGSKPGAAAAACWLAHKVVPLNQQGYGGLIEKTLYSAKEFHLRLQEWPAGEFVLAPLNDPDLNIVSFALNRVGNESLRLMNVINRRLYEEFSSTRPFKEGMPVGSQSFFVSKTDLEYESYCCGDHARDGPLPAFLKQLGIPSTQFGGADKPVARRGLADSKITVLRSTVMGPWLLEKVGTGSYLDAFLKELREVLGSVAFLNDINQEQALLELLPRLRSKRGVLLVDDHPEETDYIAQKLEEQLAPHICVMRASRTTEAEWKLADADWPIPLTVLDVEFNDDEWGGVKVLRYWRKKLRNDSQCILYTKYDYGDKRHDQLLAQVKDLDNGNVSFVSKKTEPMEVVRVILSRLKVGLEREGDKRVPAGRRRTR